MISKNLIPLNDLSLISSFLQWKLLSLVISENCFLSCCIPGGEGRGETVSQRRGARSCSRHIGLCSGDWMGKACTRNMLYGLLLTSLFCHPMVIQLPPAALNLTSVAVSVFHLQIGLVKTFYYILPSHQNHNFPEGKMMCCGNPVFKSTCCRHTDEAVLR